MSGTKWFVCCLALFCALIMQLVVIDSLHLPLGVPDVLVLTLLCIALATGPFEGMVLGFGSGLAADLVSDHPAGLLALVFCFIGYIAGYAADEAERSVLIPLGVIAAGSGASVVGYSLAALFTGDSRVGDTPVASLLVGNVIYDVVLTPFIYPLVRGLLRKLEPARL